MHAWIDGWIVWMDVWRLASVCRVLTNTLDTVLVCFKDVHLFLAACSLVLSTDATP